ncbi:uncharacterized protein PAC_18023 [Phialocephala subalpina]|uniref:Heterokaryon incompatibility domain-containing protein n=1 Tax=Phialocephala subalpina TaxID=576137 RepID=A0A1L7XSV4_9HELO|nr:uncharacterized protein PAC_18023 [Phialocephala subalpina]
MWGDGKDRRVISINGLELHVTSNLATALPFLRVDRIRTIWIDAICIYFDRYRTEYLRNLRFGPLFPEQVARRHPSEAKRVATQYVRKGMHLMTMRGRDLTPERCYDAVVGDGTCTVVLVPREGGEINKLLIASRVESVAKNEPQLATLEPKKRMITECTWVLFFHHQHLLTSLKIGRTFLSRE